MLPSLPSLPRSAKQISHDIWTETSEIMREIKSLLLINCFSQVFVAIKN
jgi:hypothetical protein